MLFGIGAGPLTDETLSVAALTTAPAGGWCWFNGPSAVHDSAHSRTVIGYLKGTNGDLCLRTVDDATLSVGTERVVYPAFEVDDHDAPAVLVRNSDGHICTAFAEHVGDIYYGEGASSGALPPAIPDAAIRNITSSVGSLSGGAGYTYAGIAQVSAVANTLFIFFRYHDSGGNAHMGYTKSTDNGDTWGARVLVNTVTYHQFAVTGADRIDFTCSPHPSSDPEPRSISHMYFVPSTEKWYKTDGTEITATKPFAASSMTTVYDGGTGLTDAWLWDVAMDGAGHPVIVYATFPSTSDHRYNYARWTGSAWVTSEITTGGGYFPTSIVSGSGAIEDHYSGGVCLDHADPTIVYTSRNVSSGRWDIYRHRTRDGGLSFTSTPLTSSGKNIRPMSVQGHDASLQVIWFEGTYANYTDYSLRTMGAGV
jgi:hypothetical protein